MKRLTKPAKTFEPPPWPNAIYPSIPRDGSYPAREFAAWISDAEEQADRLAIPIGAEADA